MVLKPSVPGTGQEQKPRSSRRISHLDRWTQLTVSQLAGCRAGQTSRDVHRLHGRDVGRELGDERG